MPIARTSFEVYIPHNINLNELLRLYPFERNIPNAKDYLLYILKIIIKVNDESEGYDPDFEQSFYQINSVKLQKTVQNYSILIKWLVSRGILECDGIYKQGAKSFGYRYAREYHKSSKVEFIVKKTLIKKLLSANTDFVSDPAMHSYGYEPLWVKPGILAAELNLKPIKMLAALRKHGLLNDKDGELHENNNPFNFFHHKIVERGGRNYPSLMINIDFLDKIKHLASIYPEDFPRK